MATDAKAFTVLTLDDIELERPNDGRVLLDVRRALGIEAFGINAFRAVGEGHVIREHDEVGFGGTEQEELYIVLSGEATFTVDRESFEAAEGSFVFVRDPAARRSAVAKELGTTILVVGGTPGKAYDPGPAEAGQAMAAYNAGDYEKAAELQEVVLRKRPDDVIHQFNAACFEARLGRTDEALDYLRLAIETDERVLESIRTDEDLDSLREDPRFRKLLG